MAFDGNRADLVVGVLGAGAMGRGIVQVAAAGGMDVLLMDTRAGAAAEAREFVGKMLNRAAEKGSELSLPHREEALSPHHGRERVNRAIPDTSHKMTFYTEPVRERERHFRC